MRERGTKRERKEKRRKDEGLCSVWLWQKWIGFRHRRRHCHSFGLAGESDSVWDCLLACLLLPCQFLYCLSSATYWHCGQLLIHTHMAHTHIHMQAAVVITAFLTFFSPSGQSLLVLSLLFICQHERIFKVTHSLCAAHAINARAALAWKLATPTTLPIAVNKVKSIVKSRHFIRPFSHNEPWHFTHY